MVILAAGMTAAAASPASAQLPSEIGGPAGDGFEPVPHVGDVRELANGLLEVRLPDGELITTHGPDPPADHQPFHTVACLLFPNQPACRDDPSPPPPPPNCQSQEAPHFRVLYGFPSDRSSRFDERRPVIRRSVADMGAFVQQYAPNHKVSYRELCNANGEVNVGVFRGPRSTEDSFSSIVFAARDAGFDLPQAKYLIYWDSSVGGFGGQGSIADDDRRDVENRHNRIDGFGTRWALVYNSTSSGTAFHETFHNMGAVQLSAPHTSGKWHCWDERDRLCYSDGGDQWRSAQFCPAPERVDCQHDDYFRPGATSGYLSTHWQVGWKANRFLDIRR